MVDDATRRECFLAFIATCLAACARNGDTIRIDLFVTAKTPLRDVWVLVGKEKYLWPTLAPDERGTFQVHLPAEQEATIRYRLPDGQTAEWKGRVDPYITRVMQADLTGERTHPVEMKLVKRMNGRTQ
ncbi:hypothetical protein F183_A49350 [Bryobacterales bacterium F-183]|nr:hypothetical protein F183_A49350 [Bryobacterales bacterium F-183]